MIKKLIIIMIFTFICSIFIIGCDSNPNNSTTKDKEIKDPYYCDAPSDCEIKDIHNCCGYYPRCVNKDYIPDIEAVKKKCIENDIVSICGYPEISECRCIENSCKSMQEELIV
jgi:hypothetical protein